MNTRSLYKICLLILVSFPILLNAQVNVSGTVVDDKGQVLEGATIDVESSTGDLQTFSHKDGRFLLNGLVAGNFELKISLLGYKTHVERIQIVEKTLDLKIQMELDPLDLEGVIVTGTFDPRSKLASSVAIATLNSSDIAKRSARGTADLLKGIAGTYVDASAGETYTRVYSRGISSSAEDDHGWFYVSLQEDGLPVSATQFTFFGPDLFHRVDLTTNRLEAIRGGSAAITSMNAPGGIYNFISKKGTPNFGGEIQMTGAFQGTGNLLYRTDVNFSGPLPMADWNYSIGGFYRYDEGPRNTNFNWGNGGQLKANAVKKYQGGYLRIFGKYLNDKINRYQGVVASDWENPKAAFDQNFNSSAVMLPRVQSDITDGLGLLNAPDATRNFDTNNGIRAKDIAFGFEIFHEFASGWSLRNQFKFSKKTADWQTSIGNQLIGLESFIPYFASAAEAPWGQVVFRDAQTDEVVARVNNFGALGPFQQPPQAPSFEYIEGSLPNDGLLGSAPWQKEDSGRDVIYQMSLGNTIGKHTINARLFAGHSATETYTAGSFAFATFENQPRMLRVTLENPGAPVEELSDAAGIANHGGLFYNHARADVSQVALALEDVWKVTDQWSFDLGARVELLGHEGAKDRFQANTREGGIDGVTTTAYDNAVRWSIGAPDEFKFNYNYVSFSLGANYQFNKKMAVFARMTNGNKAPELSYYFNNFANLPVDKAGEVQGVLQGELGLKVKSKVFNLFATGFWSRLSNISFTDFVFDQGSGSALFYTPEQINQTTTYGLEVEGNITPVQNFDLRFVATLQNPKATIFTFYDAKGNSDTSDDEIIDYSGNELPHNPKIVLEVSPSYTFGRHEVFATWRYLGERQANVANAFQLPAFSQFNAGISSRLSEHFSAMLIVNNLLNSEGLMNFFGPNEFGGNSNSVTKTFVEENPDASFIVVPVLPRSIILKIGYNF